MSAPAAKYADSKSKRSAQYAGGPPESSIYAWSSFAPSVTRLRAGARRLYTQPAYLICTDPNLPLEEILQEYIWRWDIEVNHRDEKTIIGVGQAQVRNEKSVLSIPATAVAAFAMLHLAAIKAFGQSGQPASIPPAK